LVHRSQTELHKLHPKKRLSPQPSTPLRGEGIDPVGWWTSPRPAAGPSFKKNGDDHARPVDLGPAATTRRAEAQRGSEASCPAPGKGH